VIFLFLILVGRFLKFVKRLDSVKGPRTKSLAWMEKLECINRHLGENFPVDMVNSGSDDGKDEEYSI